MLFAASTVACEGEGEFNLLAHGWLDPGAPQGGMDAPPVSQLELAWAPLPVASVQKALGVLATRAPEPQQVIELTEPPYGDPGRLLQMNRVVAMHIIRICQQAEHADAQNTQLGSGRIEVVSRGAVWTPLSAPMLEVRTQTAAIGLKGIGYVQPLDPGNDLRPATVVTMPQTRAEWNRFKQQHPVAQAIAGQQSPTGDIVHVLLHPDGAGGKPLERVHTIGVRRRRKV